MQFLEARDEGRDLLMQVPFHVHVRLGPGNHEHLAAHLAHFREHQVEFAHRLRHEAKRDVHLDDVLALCQMEEIRLAFRQLVLAHGLHAPVPFHPEQDPAGLTKRHFSVDPK